MGIVLFVGANNRDSPPLFRCVDFNSMLSVQRLLNILLLAVVYLRINFRGLLFHSLWLHQS